MTSSHEQLTIDHALPWFVPDLPPALVDQRRAHLFADHQPRLGYRVTRCGARHRLWTALQHLPDDEHVGHCTCCLNLD
jgi:hypothetical protein